LTRLRDDHGDTQLVRHHGGDSITLFAHLTYATPGKKGSEQESDEVPDWREFHDFALCGEFDSSSVRSADAGCAEGIAETGRGAVLPVMSYAAKTSWNALNPERLGPVRGHRKKCRAVAASVL
jgi:hypothetical protein